MNMMHARWITYLQKFTFVLKHQPRHQNIVVDALSRWASLLAAMSVEFVGFDFFKELYANDDNFREILAQCSNKIFESDFLIQYGFHFKGSQLYIPRTSLREHLIRELRAGGLGGHLG